MGAPYAGSINLCEGIRDSRRPGLYKVPPQASLNVVCAHVMQTQMAFPVYLKRALGRSTGHSKPEQHGDESVCGQV